MSSNPRVALFALALAALAAPARASAEPKPAAEASANDEKARFAEAVRLYKANDFAAALPEFEALASETGSPNARLYVGYCYVGLERPADAYAAFEQAARSAGSDERYDETRTAALSELSNLTLRIAKIVVAPVEQPDGLVVKVDGVPLDPEAFGSHRVFAAGDHRVEASATDRDPIVRDIHVAAGETKTVTLYFPKRETAAPSNPPPRDAEPNRGSALRTAGFVAAGVGGAGLVTFIVGGLEARSAYNDLERACGTTPCTDAAHQRDADRGKSWQTVANVGLVVGGIGAATSATLLYFGYREGATSVALAPLAGGAIITGKARF
jgi:tetratricopeptide (TPR) repeat protein